MTFSELTWNADCFNEATNQNMGFQAQYEADNGYLIVIDTVLADKTEENPNGVALELQQPKLDNCIILQHGVGIEKHPESLWHHTNYRIAVK